MAAVSHCHPQDLIRAKVTSMLFLNIQFYIDSLNSIFKPYFQMLKLEIIDI